MNHSARCCQCPWETKSRDRGLWLHSIEAHQNNTGHSRIKLVISDLPGMEA